MRIEHASWKVEIWAEDEDFRLRREDRACERVRIMTVTAETADEARQVALEHPEVRARWPRANAAVFPLAR